MNLETLKRFLIEKCEPKLAHKLITWIYSEEAKEEIEKELKAYEDSGDSKVDSEKVFNQILFRINKEVEEVRTMEVRTGGRSHTSKRKGFIWVAAASVLLVLGVMFVLSNGNQSVLNPNVAMQTMTKSTEMGQKLMVRLPDGSHVKLNAGSSLSYGAMDGDSRVVELQGEAFFDVKRDENRPFIVKTSNMRVRVLGTSFNVEAGYVNEAGVVAVRTGKVEVRDVTSNQFVLLKKGEFTTMQSEDKLVVRTIDNPDLQFGWIENKLVFENTNVNEALNEISAWFGYQIKSEIDVESLDNLTGAYENPTLIEVMESLSYAYKFNYKIKDHVILIE